MRKLTVFILLLLLLCYNAFTQGNPVKTLPFQAITIEDGLSQGMVHSILQDKYGFMWFATKDGLNRYDGYNFTAYRHDAADKSTLADNYVFCLFEDSKGRLWVGTGTQGLDLFNRETETFTHFQHNDKNPRSLCSNSVWSLFEDGDGEVYVNTGYAISTINQTKTAAGKDSLFFTKIDSADFTKTAFPQKGTIWAAASYKKMHALIKQKDGSFERQPIDLNTYHFGKQQKTEGSYVHFFAKVAGENSLYLFMTDGITKYNYANRSFEDAYPKPFRLDYSSEGFYDTSSGLVWMPDIHGIQLYDIKQREVYNLQAEVPEYNKWLMAPNCIYKDRGGNIWIGTKGYGVLKYNPGIEKFHATGKESIVYIGPARDGNVTVVKQSAPFANIYNKVLRAYTHTIPDSSQLVKKNHGFDQTDAVVLDSNGTYWIGKVNLLQYNDESKTANYVTTDMIYSFPLFAAADGIWFGAREAFKCYNPATKQLRSYKYLFYPSEIPYRFVEAIHRQSDSIFWLGTTSGLFKLNIVTGAWQQYKSDATDTTSLSFDVIFSLCADPLQPAKYLWVGTNGGGLNRFEYSTGKFTRYTMKNGLSNNVVYGILSDNLGSLWMSTNKGISKYSIAKNIFHNYEKKDGLQGDEFNRYAYCKTTDGTLYFGGVNGFNYFNPADLEGNTTPPATLITTISVINKPVGIGDQTNILQRAAYLTDKITLQYADNMVSFEFAAMDFLHPTKNTYQYKLVGFDKDWIDNGTAHTATYTNLDPGTYTFLVRGVTSTGVVSQKSTAMLLVVLPPWYLTWWFRTLAVIAIVTAAYLFYRYRLNQALKLQGIRNKIASDLHDEIGSNLSSISIFSDVAKEDAAGQPVSAVLDKISSYTQESMEAMSDIVWMINAGNDRFENIIVRMRQLAVELIEAKKSTLHLEIDERLNTIKLDMNQRKNFWLIYKEALNNIAKYADAANVWVKLTLEHKYLLLTIKDDGKGFDTTTLSSGNGLKNMQQRAIALNGNINIISAKNKGTSVHLRARL